MCCCSVIRVNGRENTWSEPPTTLTHRHSPVYDVLSATSIAERTFLPSSSKDDGLVHNPDERRWESLIGSRIRRRRGRQCGANWELRVWVWELRVWVWGRGLRPPLFMGTSQIKKHCEHDVKTAAKTGFSVIRSGYKTIIP